MAIKNKEKTAFVTQFIYDWIEQNFYLIPLYSNIHLGQGPYSDIQACVRSVPWLYTTVTLHIYIYLK